jgi:hypothetical protein
MSKDKQWKPWIDLYDQYCVDLDAPYVNDRLKDDILIKVNKRDGTLVALALAVAKWHPKAKYRGRGECALCSLTSLEENGTCYDCPLYKKEGKSCNQWYSLWRKFDSAETYKDQDKAANKMYKTLLELYKEEYRKVMG